MLHVILIELYIINACLVIKKIQLKKKMNNFSKHQLFKM